MTELSLTSVLLIASVAGLFPALLWVGFWLKEDKAHPEPKKRIIYTFLFGMLSVPFAFVSELGIQIIFLQGLSVQAAVAFVPILGALVVVLWAFVEELVKYFAAYYGGIKRKANDEPMDVVIYLIIASLGFAALENAIFLLEPLFNDEIRTALVRGNLRFVGASLVHVASSGIIGIAVAFSYFKAKRIKKRYLGTGFIVAVALHAAFNLLIIKDASNVLPAFFGIWIVIILVIIILERIKKIHLNKIKTVN